MPSPSHVSLTTERGQDHGVYQSLVRLRASQLRRRQKQDRNDRRCIIQLDPALEAGSEEANPEERQLSKTDLEDAGQKPMFRRAPSTSPFYLKSKKLIEQKMRGPMPTAST